MLYSTRRTFFAGTASAALAPAFVASAKELPKGRNLLASAFPPGKLQGALMDRDRWKPYPVAADRAAWSALPEDALKRMAAAGEEQVGKPWPMLPATLFLEYRRNGNRSRFEAVCSARRSRLRELVLAECAVGNGRFLDEIVNGVWAVCEETSWVYPAHLSMQKAGHGLPDIAEPVVDLFNAETAAQMAWALYLLEPQLGKINPLIPERIRLEIDRRILTPCMERNDFSWMGLDDKRHSLNNWTPWIDSNWLTCALLVERDAARRTAAVHRAMRSVDCWLNSYYPDGGCDEGPGYWGRAGASLFDCLDLLHSASAGTIDFYRDPLVGEIGRYIYRAHIAEDWFINFADASASNHIAADLVFRYGRAIGDEKMAAFGADGAQRHGDFPRESIGRTLPALFNLKALREAKRYQPLVRDVWLPGIEVMAARATEGSTTGLYLAAQGGHNAESHNHNDVGNFIVFADGKPAIIDIGVETYTAKTFSPQRYEIWTMQSAYHNLPTIGGVMQAAGRQFEATSVSHRADAKEAVFALDLAKAYPPAAGILSWKRTLRMDRSNNEIEVVERYSLSKPSAITLTLMTPCRPVSAAPGRLSLEGTVEVLFDGNVLKPEIEEIKITDGRLRSSWGERLYRVLLKADKAPASGAFSVRIRQQPG